VITIETSKNTYTPGLSRGHFRKIASNGFGDGGNSYAWGRTWFKDHLYVGTNRHLLVLLLKRFPYKVPMPVWPVPTPESTFDLDLAAQVWRYNPDTDIWQRVYKAPMVDGIDNHRVPLAYGFRNMAVFQGKSDREPVIYTIPTCGSYGKGPVLLRCEDGVNFEVRSEPGLGLGDASITSFRGVVPFKGKLFITPSGTRGGYCNQVNNMVVLCTDDPANGKWEVSNTPCFGDTTNYGIFEMNVGGNYLYACTINIRRGCQLWRTDGEGPTPHQWVLVADRGFDRGPLNEMMLSSAYFNGAMYVGTGIQNGGYDRINNVGPAPAEIIRVNEDGTWDLLVGEPRVTRFGPKFPTSGMRAGFDNFFSGYMWRMTAHDGALYAGTYDGACFLPYADPNQWPPALQNILDRDTIDRYLQVRGGTELWRTTDGNTWVPITRNGFGNYFNYGIRAIISTPRGLFVGTANPFGPQVAVRTPSGWRYEDNPLGGLEVWHGSLENAGVGEGLSLPPERLPEIQTLEESDEAIMALSQFSGIASTPSIELSDGYPDSLDSLEGAELPPQKGLVLDEFPTPDGPRVYSVNQMEPLRQGRRGTDPLYRLAATDTNLGTPPQSTELDLEEYFGGELQNAGYWRIGGTDVRNIETWREESGTPAQACRLLITEMLDLLPVNTSPAVPLKILAIGKGPGTLASEILLRKPGASVAVIAGSQAEMDSIRKREPRATVVRSQPDLRGVSHESFDVVVCIEGAGENNRPTNLRSANRVLKSGGHLICSDLVASPNAQENSNRPKPNGDSKNPASQAYAHDLQNQGFSIVKLSDITPIGWQRFFYHSRKYFTSRMLLHLIDTEQRDHSLAALPGGARPIEAHLLACAVKLGGSSEP
jgi:SAM-dependent methyltransferase